MMGLPPSFYGRPVCLVEGVLLMSPAGQSAGPSSRPSAGTRSWRAPPSSRGLSPMLRTTPIPEDMTVNFSADDDAARRAWDPHHRDARVERQIKIRGCLDLSAVLNTIPDYYRGVLSSIGSDLYLMLDELDAVTRRKSKADAMKAKGEIPFSYNSIKLPSIQFTKRAASSYKEHFSLPGKDLITEAQKKLFDFEIHFLSEQIVDLQNKTDIRALVQGAWSALQRRYEARPKVDSYEVQIPDPNTEAGWPAELRAEMLTVSKADFLVNELRALQVDLPVYLQKFKDLKMDMIEKVRGLADKKAKEKRDVDVEMKDVASSSNIETRESINSEVQKQVAAAFQKYIKTSPGSSSSKVRGMVRGSYMDPTHSLSIVEKASEQEDFKGEKEGEEGVEGLHPTHCQGDSPGDQSAEARTPFWRRVQARKAWEEREGKRKAERIVGQIKGMPWTFGVPSSYPDLILNLPPSYQANVLLSRAPMSLLDANRFRSSVHVQPGVEVPEAIQHDLSASLKFMFETQIDKTLISKAYADLVRRIRWKWYFMDRVGDSYDPDYDVRKALPLDKQKRKPAPLAAPHIERGLNAGQDYVDSILTSLTGQDKATGFPTPINVKRAREFLVSNNLIVTNTDKNLGVAVFKREWIYNQSVVLFGDKDNYSPLTKEEATNYLADMAKYIEELCEVYLQDEEQLSTFMSHCLPDASHRSEWAAWAPYVPEAYAIPKIHKNPWKGRPICPGFSLPQNAASKFCAKTLRPWIETRSWVIQGSKDFVRKLADVKIPVDRKAFIVSADVVAFYPSIDVQLLREALVLFADKSIIPKEVEQGIISPQQVESRSDFYGRMFRVALAGPVMTFMDQILYQHKGLPMGAAGSPDMANMFGLWYEMQWIDELSTNSNVLFFGRYLDDIYSVVLADSPDEASALLTSIVHYGDVKLLWEPPSDKAVFLDLSTELRGDRIYHEPFVKAMSHRERIPWSSAHPKDVKKGTFCSEISRLATLCSDRDVYALQCKEAVNLYIGRGYPKGLVTHWLEDQEEKRWANRLAEKSAEDPTRTFFTLKTHFNDAWKGFNVQELESRITAQWDQHPIVAGRKRNRLTDGSLVAPKRRRVNVGFQGAFPGQSMLRITQDDGTDMVMFHGASTERTLVDTNAEFRRQQELKWTRQWIDTGKFLVSRRKNTQLWDITRGWNHTVWDLYMDRSGMLRPFDPLYEGLVMSDGDVE